MFTQGPLIYPEESMTNNSITVVTLTNNRIQFLLRAIESVNKQNYYGRITHLILIDDCEATRKFLEENKFTSNHDFQWKYIKRDTDHQHISSRLSRIRNIGINLARSNWICFLDDDNEFEPDHLSSLVKCATRTGCQAVYSWERIFWRDGSPYLVQEMPWCRNAEDRVKNYQFLTELGVFQPGTNISRDRADSCDHENPVWTVDMGEWLFECALLKKYPFPEDYSELDWKDLTTEDDKLMKLIIDNKIQVACSEQVTFKYYLGGFTSDFLVKPE